MLGLDTSVVSESKRRAKLPYLGMGVTLFRRAVQEETRLGRFLVDPQRFASAIGTWRTWLPILLFRGIRRFQRSNRLEIRMLL